MNRLCAFLSSNATGDRKARRTTHFLYNNRGIVLPASVGIVVTMITLTAGTIVMGLSEINAAERLESRMVAFHWAEGALDQTLVALRNDSNFSGINAASASNERLSGLFSSTVTRSDTDPNVYTIQSLGQVNQNGTTAGAQRRIQVVVDLTPPYLFTEAVFAQNKPWMARAVTTDSYNSRLGFYNSFAPGTNGDVATNKIGLKAIELGYASYPTWSATVKGDVIVGVGGNPATDIYVSAGSTITGQRLAASQMRTLPPIKIPPNLQNRGALDLGRGGAIFLSLPGGTYLWDSILIWWGSTINFTGPATVYVNGNVQINGRGLLTFEGKPYNLRLFVKGTSFQWSPNSWPSTGTARMYAALYAPNASVSFGWGGDAYTYPLEFYGALVGNSHSSMLPETSAYVRIHYDESLSVAPPPNQQGGAANKQVISWTEV